jgi:signal transduction histidine kinase
LLVAGTNAILYGAVLIRGEQNVGELLWRVNGITLILLPITGALYLLLPSGAGRGERLPYHQRLASAISILLTAIYGSAVVGAAAVLLSVTGYRLNGGEWLLFCGIFLATIIFSPVLRWSEEVADRYIFTRWKGLEIRSQEFIERIGTELTPVGIAHRIAEDLPTLLNVPHASLALSTEALDSWRVEAGDALEIMAQGEFRARMAGGSDDPARVPIRYPDGTAIGVLHLGAPLEPDTPQIAILGTLAQAIAAALRNAESYLRLRQAEQELADAERVASLGALASGLAHEIKNPLASLKMGLYLLERDAVKPQTFLRLQRDLRRIDDLVLGLLRFTHDGAGEAHMPVSLHAVIDECTVDILPVIEDRGILLRREDVAEEVRVLGAPAPIRLLVSNLLRNALDAAGPGGVVRVRTKLSGAEVEFVVQDDGPGIPAEHQDRIFELNFSTKPGGSGLGLALARREAERLGGRIEVESTEGEGTLLRVVLPRVI